MTERTVEPIFARCAEFRTRSQYARELGYPGNPRMLQALGLYPYFVPFAETTATEATIGGRTKLMLGSNNYLGMTSHPRVIAAAQEAMKRYGTGCTGSRLLNGTLELHRELENRLARFVGKESALVFSTGYQTNLGVIAGLLGKHDVVFADKEVHASLIDGIRLARGSAGVRARYFEHNRVSSLDRLLASANNAGGKLVVVDGLYSMSGDVAPLADLVETCRIHGARLLVDDAHALGVLGDSGRGTPSHFRCVDEVDLVTGTFSKSFGSCGGFVAGPADVMEWLKHTARSFLFSASLPPANAATVLAILDLLEESDEPVLRVNRAADMMREKLSALGYEVRKSHGAIVPIVVGDELRAVQAWRKFFDRGVYTNAIVPPAVRPEGAGLRTSYMATHTDEQLASGLAVFEELAPWVQRVREQARRRAVSATVTTPTDAG